MIATTVTAAIEAAINPAELKICLCRAERIAKRFAAAASSDVVPKIQLPHAAELAPSDCAKRGGNIVSA